MMRLRAWVGVRATGLDLVEWVGLDPMVNNEDSKNHLYPEGQADRCSYLAH